MVGRERVLRSSLHGSWDGITMVGLSAVDAHVASRQDSLQNTAIQERPVAALSCVWPCEGVRPSRTGQPRRGRNSIKPVVALSVAGRGPLLQEQEGCSFYGSLSDLTGTSLH